MFCVLRHHFAPRHFYPEVGQKNPESRRKKRNLARLGVFFGPRHLCWESKGEKKNTPTGWLGTFFCRAEFVGMFLVTAAIGIYSGMALVGSTSRHWSVKEWDVWFSHCECSFKLATIMSFVPAHLRFSMIHFIWWVKIVFTSERFCSQTLDVRNVEYITCSWSGKAIPQWFNSK